MERKIQAVIFDQDGLMFDTERISAKAWNRAGADLGIRLEESFLCTIRGMVWKDAIKRFKEELGDGFDYEALRIAKQKIFLKLLRNHGVPVKKGLRELLEYLKTHNYKIVLATASNMEYSKTNLEETGIDGYFEYMVTGDMVKHAKPDPEVFLKAAELVGEEPGQCLVLEDSLNGVTAGLNGGFHVIMVPDLTQPGDEMRKNVDQVCDSLLDVIDYLEKE